MDVWRYREQPPPEAMLPSEIVAYANEKLAEHGLDEKGWRFQFDYAKTRFGYCSWRKHVISLSIYLCALNTDNEIIDTILHEIAHALAGARHGHNYVWRRIALEIGCNGKRCHSAQVAAPNFIVRCPNCGKEDYGYRKPRFRAACGRCCKRYNGGAFDARFLLEYNKYDA